MHHDLMASVPPTHEASRGNVHDLGFWGWRNGAGSAAHQLRDVLADLDVDTAVREGQALQAVRAALVHCPLRRLQLRPAQASQRPLVVCVQQHTVRRFMAS